MPSAADYIEDLQTNGRSVFTTEEAVQALGKSVTAVRAALRRLKDKGRIADPYRGFHVVVPPAYRRLGCLPADHFVPQLMAHLGEPYYVALLSAAAYHGAAHQAPMVFQVMVRKSRRGLACGGVRVDFVARQGMENTPVVERNTPTGVLRIASPAATALELVGYPERCGYLDNVATVLAELAESIDGESLAAEARRVPVAWVQRLGYLLVLVEADGLAEHLDAVLSERNVFTVPLAPWRAMEGTRRDDRWHVAINTDVEPDV
jgi:predicted transcriptional regulator of viral defense system